jgi:phosphatidylglycerol:prolipoprotein diacylglycerol transferase
MHLPDCNQNIYCPDKYLSGLTNALDPAKWGVHPTFLYESLWDFAVFFFLLWYRKKKKKLTGEVLFLYLVFYGIGRFIIEGLRTDSLYLGSIRVSQMLSALLVLAFAVLFIYRRRKKSKASEEEPVALGQSQYGSLLTRMKEEEGSTEAKEDRQGGAGTEEEVSTGEADAAADEVEKDASEEDDSEPDEGTKEE